MLTCVCVCVCVFLCVITQKGDPNPRQVVIFDESINAWLTGKALLSAKKWRQRHFVANYEYQKRTIFLCKLIFFGNDALWSWHQRLSFISQNHPGATVASELWHLAYTCREVIITSTGIGVSGYVVLQSRYVTLFTVSVTANAVYSHNDCYITDEVRDEVFISAISMPWWGWWWWWWW